MRSVGLKDNPGRRVGSNQMEEERHTGEEQKLYVGEQLAMQSH